MESKIAAAYQHCLAITRGHYENFPVASWLLPKRLRPAVASVYAFARGADDFADEGDIPAQERLNYLDDWQEQLEACVSQPTDSPVFLALGETIRQYELPVQPFRDLLTAFRRDVTVCRYATWESLLNDYCRFSANPVGRLVLLLFGYRDENLFVLSDHICTALQLANFWQDVSVDLEKGRIYVPIELMKEHGYSEDEFRGRVYNANFKSLHATLIEKTRLLFQKGARLPLLVGGRLGWELRFVWVGGMRILRKVEAHPEVFNSRPVLAARDFPGFLIQACMYRKLIK
ncbi:MAG: squalene synthase HpnC [bacterium]